MPQRQIIEPELTWTGSRFERGVRLVIEPDGRLGPVQGAAGQRGRALADRAVLPGMVNVHSHAFQRGLRGRGERFEHGRGSFWTWREAMYGLVESMTEQAIYELSCRAYREMLAAGITTVGEFHYLRHDETGRGHALDEAVLKAASDTGIRIVLLPAYYRTGGVGQELSGPQRRFRTDSPEEYWLAFDHLSSIIDPATQALGVAAHSIRAVPPQELIALHREADRRGLVFHMHVEEQTAEIDACLEAYGRRPMELINEELRVSPRFCAVHCTQTSEDGMRTFLDAGGSVCICPLTEANLGDGIAAAGRIHEAGGRLCLGTDSNARISFTEEMRWLEYVQRLASRSRGVCVDEEGWCAAALWRAATINGAAALGLGAGVLEPGAPADLIALDVEAPALAGWTDETLLDAFIFGAGSDAIAEVCVGGVWR